MNDITNKLAGLTGGKTAEEAKAQQAAIADTQEKQENQKSPETLKEPPEGSNEAGGQGDLEQTHDVIEGGEAAEVNAEPKAIYTSHPIQNLSFGKFKFVDGVLSLYTDDEAERFKSILDKLPPAERNKVKTISLDLANQIASENGNQMVRGFDSGMNPAADKLRQQPVRGTTNMGTKESGN